MFWNGKMSVEGQGENSNDGVQIDSLWFLINNLYNKYMHRMERDLVGYIYRIVNCYRGYFRVTLKKTKYRIIIEIYFYRE